MDKKFTSSLYVTYITLYILKWIIVYSFYYAKVGNTLGALYKMMYLDDFSDREKIGDRLNIFFPKDSFINYIKKSNHKKREVYFLSSILLHSWSVTHSLSQM